MIQENEWSVSGRPCELQHAMNLGEWEMEYGHLFWLELDECRVGGHEFRE